MWLIHVLFLASPALASLGGSLDSIEEDRKALGENLPATSLTIVDRSSRGYDVHEITLDGTKVREYVTPDGAVFAVAWRGVSEPDLSVLLGRFYSDYESAAAAPSRRRSRQARSLHSGRMVVERSGHMRDVRGRAYLSDRLPGGFHLEDIQ